MFKTTFERIPVVKKQNWWNPKSIKTQVDFFFCPRVQFAVCEMCYESGLIERVCVWVWAWDQSFQEKGTEMQPRTDYADWHVCWIVKIIYIKLGQIFWRHFVFKYNCISIKFYIITYFFVLMDIHTTSYLHIYRIQ